MDGEAPLVAVLELRASDVPRLAIRIWLASELGLSTAKTLTSPLTPLAAATVEKIELKDDDLKRIWGESLYRVLLTSTAPVDGGKWEMEIA